MLLFIVANQVGFAISAKDSFILDQKNSGREDNLPAAPDGIEGLDEICPGTPTIYKVSGSNSQNTTHWQIENGLIINGNPGNEVTVVFRPNNSPYKIRARQQNKENASKWVEKTINPIDVDFLITGADTVYSSTYSTYSINETRGDKYTWRIRPQHLGSVINQEHSDEVKILWNNVTAPTVATLMVEVEICKEIYYETFRVTVDKSPDTPVNASPKQDENPCADASPTKHLQAPTAVINAPSKVCPGQPIQFTATVNDPDLTYLWDFGELAKNSLPNPIKVFSADYPALHVMLTVTNRQGCEGRTYHTIIIQQHKIKGSIIPTPASNCIGETIQLMYNPFPGTFIPDIYHWKFNGNTVSTETSTFTATQPGEYVLDAETLDGCYEKRIATINIAFFDTPIANITGPDEVSTNHKFQLENLRNNPTHTYTWTRNGEPLPQFNGMHSIVTSENSPGVYTYELTILSGFGCSDTDRLTINVTPL